MAELKRLLDAHDAKQAKPPWPELGQSPVMLDHSLIEPRREDDEYVYWGN